jgi:hypothetical protein
MIAAMQAYVGVAAVQEQGCDAISIFARGVFELHHAVLAAGGVETVIAAMQAQVGVASVQEAACKALTMLVLLTTACKYNTGLDRCLGIDHFVLDHTQQ